MLIETVLAWIFLIAGLYCKNETLFIASGLFAIAANVLRKKDDSA